MNAQRRKEIDKCLKAANEIQKMFENIVAAAESLSAQIEAIMEAEQEAYQNLPQSIQDGDKGLTMDNAVWMLQAAIDSAEAITTVEFNVDEIIGNLEAAKE